MYWIEMKFINLKTSFTPTKQAKFNQVDKVEKNLNQRSWKTLFPLNLIQFYWKLSPSNKGGSINFNSSSFSTAKAKKSTI